MRIWCCIKTISSTNDDHLCSQHLTYEQWTNSIRRKQLLITLSSQSCLSPEIVISAGLQTQYTHILSVSDLYCIQFVISVSELGNMSVKAWPSS